MPSWKAKPLHERALAIAEKPLGLEHFPPICVFFSRILT
jgi:hypothetical protein